MSEYTPITILRGSSATIDQTAIVDGQILFDEGRRCLYMDDGVTRTKYSGFGADSNVATVEDTTTSTGTYVKGDYVIVQGQLYEVTQAIAIGDTFNPASGGNITTTTVGRELSQLNSQKIGKWTFKKNMILNDTLDVSGLHELLFVLQDSTIHVSRGCLVIPINWFEGGNSIEINTYVDQRRYANFSYSNGVITLYNADFGNYIDIVTVYGR